MRQIKKTGVIPQSHGSLPEIIRNAENLYEGNLVHYFQALFFRAQNVLYPYHNFRHMCHVMWLCHGACLFYRDTLSPREMRNLLIAALFHDFDHSGMMGNDDLNIERAIRGLRKHVALVDAPHLENIVALIRATEYPYVIESEKLNLCGNVLRDADMGQTLNVAWIQQVIFGLATEWGMMPLDVLKTQEPFLKKLTFRTAWAQQQFPTSEIAAKIREARELIELLEAAVQIS